jgi:hypothetical protein
LRFHSQQPETDRRRDRRATRVASNSRSADKFDVKIITTEDHPFFAEYEGKTYLRDGVKRVWLNDDLQSFTRYDLPPTELMAAATAPV